MTAAIMADLAYIRFAIIPQHSSSPPLSQYLLRQAIKQHIQQRCLCNHEVVTIQPFQDYELCLRCTLPYGVSQGTLCAATDIILEREAHVQRPNVDLSSYDQSCMAQLTSLLQKNFRAKTVCDTRVQSVLVSGPRGSGKSTVIAGVAHMLGIPVVYFEALSAIHVEADILLRREMSAHPNSIIVIEHADLVLNSRMEAALKLQLIATLRARRSAFYGTILLETSEPSEVDQEVRGCLGHVVEFSIPTPAHRKQIWLQHVSSEEAEALSRLSHGFVGADIEAAMVAQRLREEELGTKLTLAQRCDITRQTTPAIFASGSSSGSGTVVDVLSPRDIETGFGDIGGLEAIKEVLRESIVWPLKHGKELASLGIRAPRGILLHGLPGTGKTMLASAVAKEAEMSFLSFTVSDLLHGYVGESEKTLSSVFAIAHQIAPCILFFDEFQAIFGRRVSAGEVGKKLVSQLLLEMDAIDRSDHHIILIGATNVMQGIDPALLRFGRFDKRIQVPLPDAAARLYILNRCRVRLKHWESSIDMQELVRLTQGFSGAEIASLCNQAGLEAFQTAQDKRTEPTITKEHILKAVRATKAYK